MCQGDKDRDVELGSGAHSKETLGHYRTDVGRRSLTWEAAPLDSEPSAAGHMRLENAQSLYRGSTSLPVRTDQRVASSLSGGVRRTPDHFVAPGDSTGCGQR
jgi:hypothetical protein